MPPKKREKDGESSKTPRNETIHADHELFLQAFEKPTQIYRFLRTRNMISPIFLNRTLLYMKQRMSRSHKTRPNFKVDSLLERILSKRNDLPAAVLPGYMTITFLGYYDKTLDFNLQSVLVETILVKICHKKRKDSASPALQVSFGTVDVAINPADESASQLSPSISIPKESFNLNNGPLVKSYVLLLRVQCLPNNCVPSDDDVMEPAIKRRKSITNGFKNEGSKLFCSELVVYDKYNRCLLTDGDYELGLQEVSQSIKTSPRKHSSWEYITDLNDSFAPFDTFNKSPMIKFKLCWTKEPSRGLVERPKLYSVTENKENIPQQTNNNNNNQNKDKLQIVYQFLYNNNSRQQTEACEDLHCPWCSVDCMILYALLKHLKLCHSRFTFTYVPISQGARIDVAINELYDGSYTGSPHDLIAQPSGCPFSRNGPVRRATVTNILVCRPKRLKPSLNEFLELDDLEFDGQRTFITGHNRLYHHTNTCLPIYPKEMDQDSEGENDPEWLQVKTSLMIDEFTDVNEGEKELMKLWNLHVMKFGYVGDCQIPLACTMFLQNKGKELLMQNLYRNFIIHLCSLFDFGLISPVTLYATVKKMQELMGENDAIRKILKESREAQMEHWIKTGIFQQPPTQKTPNVVRKTATPISGQSRRKGTTNNVELPLRRKSAADSSRKRLSLSLKKDESQG